MNNLSKVVTQQRCGRTSNSQLLDRKSDALPLSHPSDEARLIRAVRHFLIIADELMNEMIRIL